MGGDQLKHYLVTGCAGFIASKVSEMLLEAGHRVTGIDNLNDAYDPRLKQWRLARLEGRPNFRFQRVDIADRAALAAHFARDAAEPQPAGGPYSAVFNLAARAGVRPSVENPWTYYEANAAGALNLLDLCRRHGVKKFILASTSSLYGAHNPVPFAEDADTNRPLSPYAASKKAAETLCYTYHHLHGLDVTVFRYFTVYGPAGRPDMSVFRFCRWIAESQPITVFGDGTQQRDFTYVDDIARGTIAGLAPLGYEVINLGGDRPVRLDRIIHLVSEMSGREPAIEYRPAHPADVPATWARVEKAQRLLGWRPEVGIEEGLRRCVAWYQENRELAGSLSLGAT
ncbi:MAG: GDP-mannose 4,6-dehydratase [Pirellulales bacterium]|nr:GDP-mannose 4,6-dehydratase [Thermoguttaceae bacterium]MDD4786641.1 GDP-mannose 4,6-dehydratase [Pirellulales bacterium]